MTTISEYLDTIKQMFLNIHHDKIKLIRTLERLVKHSTLKCKCYNDKECAVCEGVRVLKELGVNIE